VFTGGIIDNNAPQLYKDLHAAMPEAKLFGPDGVATVDFTKEIPGDVQRQTFLTAPTLSPDELPPAGQQFYKDYEAEYGEAQDEIDPYAVYGYEAMAVVCDAITEGGEDRAAVVEAFFNTQDRESPLGTYSIDQDGDTTLSDYGGYKAEGGKLVFNKVIKAATS
jgi:branched-chain amino acid transport system substrate-binding protein